MKTNIYEEKKKFNIIDALIIFLIIALILVVIFRAQLISLFNDTGKRSDVEISFVCEEIPTELLPSLFASSTVSWLEADVTMGTLTITEEAEKAIEYYYDEDNNLCIRELQDKSRFKGKINNLIILSGDFSSPLSIINKTTKQKINKDIEDLKSTINH